MEFGKVLTAMVTPFDQEENIDYEQVKILVEHLIQTGTDTIVVAGSTGESPTITATEKLMLFEAVKKQANNRVKVIANAGSNNTKESIAFVKEIERLQVADGLMLVNPYYNKPTQEGLYMHFKTIAENTTLPIMVYNIPGRTAVNLQATTMIRLSHVPNIVAVKESSGDLSQMATIIEGTSDDFSVYVGDDNLALPAYAIGAKGVVSVASHIVGQEIQAMFAAFEQGNTKKAAELHRSLLPFFEGIFFTTNPLPIKQLLNETGINVGGVRLPLVPLTKEEQITARNLLTLLTKKQIQ